MNMRFCRVWLVGEGGLRILTGLSRGDYCCWGWRLDRRLRSSFVSMIYVWTKASTASTNIFFGNWSWKNDQMRFFVIVHWLSNLSGCKICSPFGIFFGQIRIWIIFLHSFFDKGIYSHLDWFSRYFVEAALRSLPKRGIIIKTFL